MGVVEIIFAGATAAVVGLILFMLRSAYRAPIRSSARPRVRDYVDDTPLGTLENYVRERIASIETPAITLALRSRLEIDDVASDSERRLLFFELLSDLDRLQPVSLPSELTKTLKNRLALVPAMSRDGAAMHFAVGRLRTHLSTTLGSEMTEELLAEFPPEMPDDAFDSVRWMRSLSDGSASSALQSLLKRCSIEFGQLEAVQILERAAREVGRVFPLSCLKGFLAAFPSGLLSAEKASASARDRIWDEYLAARQELDMARLRLAEAEVNKWASVGRLAAGMAHEINNPLVYIMGNLSMLQDDLLANAEASEEREEQVEMMSDAMEGLDRIRNIVSDLQVFSRTRRDKRQEVDLERVLQSTVKVVQAQAGRGIDFKMELEGIPKVVVDEGKIGQVILNLLINASHVSNETKQESVTLRTGQKGEMIFLEIEDRGSGVDPENRKKIFEPFFTTKEIDEGTGLGLAISREIAEQHGGSLVLVPEYTAGARFRLSLPLGEKEIQEPEGHKAQPTRVLRILFVDDDEGIRKLADRSLGKTHTLTLASDGAEAQAILKRDSNFDAIILDLQLPKIDGSELFAWMESEHPRLARRTLIMTGGPTTARAADFLATHSAQTLSKPATPNEIEQALLRIADSESTPSEV